MLKNTVPQILKIVSEESTVQRRVSPRLKNIPESGRPPYATSRGGSLSHSEDQNNQVSEQSTTKQSFENSVSSVATVKSTVPQVQKIASEESSVQRRVSPRLKNISERERPCNGTSGMGSVQRSEDQNDQESDQSTRNQEFENCVSSVTTMKSTVLQVRKIASEESSVQRRVNRRLNISEREIPCNGTSGRGSVQCLEDQNDQESDQSTIIQEFENSVSAVTMMNSILPQVRKIASEESSVQRRVSPRLKNISERERPCNDTSGRGSAHRSGDQNDQKSNQTTRNQEFENSVSAVTMMKSIVPQVQKIASEESSVHTRVSPQLNYISASERPSYVTSGRGTLPHLEDQNNQESKQSTRNQEFKNNVSAVTMMKSILPQVRKIASEESSMQIRASPRLKNISESERPYVTSGRGSLPRLEDRNNWESEQSMRNQEFENNVSAFTMMKCIVPQVRKIASEDSFMQRRVSLRLKNISESERPCRVTSVKDSLRGSKNQDNQESDQSTRNQECENDILAVITTKSFVPHVQKIVNEQYPAQRRVNPRLKKISESVISRTDSLQGSKDQVNQDSENCPSALTVTKSFVPHVQKIVNEQYSVQRRVSPRLKKIYESERHCCGTSRCDSLQGSKDLNNRESDQSTRSQDFEKDKAAVTAVKSFVMHAQKIVSEESYVQRSVSPHLKKISESGRPCYGTSQRDSLRGSKGQDNQESDQSTRNQEFKNNKSAVTATKCFVPHVQNIVPTESSLQRRFSPRLKNISESERPCYATSGRDSLPRSEDQNNQESEQSRRNQEFENSMSTVTMMMLQGKKIVSEESSVQRRVSPRLKSQNNGGNVYVNHFVPKSSANMSGQRVADKESKSELNHLVQKGLPNGTCEKVMDQGSMSDLAILNAATCSAVGNIRNINSKVEDFKLLDVCNSSRYADGERVDARMKETLRPYNRDYLHVQLFRNLVEQSQLILDLTDLNIMSKDHQRRTLNT
ncbi:hypothetical protein U1Q18_017394 [Sarracenia purpurea var. burkii]